MTTTLLLIRHARPEDYEHGYPRRLSGWHDVPLGVAGRGEAALLARRLQQEDLASPIYSSPLRRAMQTAETIAQQTALEIADAPQLQEIYCGEVEGQLLEQVQQRYPVHWTANLRQDDPDFRWPGGESYREFRTRCLACIEEIAARHESRRVAVVTHAGVISQLMGHIRDVSPARWGTFRPDTASVTVLEWQAGSGAVLVFDDRQHLQACEL